MPNGQESRRDGRDYPSFQPSLRDVSLVAARPNVETSGYSQAFVRQRGLLQLGLGRRRVGSQPLAGDGFSLRISLGFVRDRTNPLGGKVGTASGGGRVLAGQQVKQDWEIRGVRQTSSGALTQVLPPSTAPLKAKLNDYRSNTKVTVAPAPAQRSRFGPECFAGHGKGRSRGSNDIHRAGSR